MNPTRHERRGLAEIEKTPHHQDPQPAAPLDSPTTAPSTRTGCSGRQSRPQYHGAQHHRADRNAPR